MRFRNLTIFASALAIVLSLTPGRAAAQTNWKAPLAADGHPDISGVWANNNATPLQRPKALEGRDKLTDAEVDAMRKKAAELYDGKGDAEFGDAIFDTVWTAIQNHENGSHRKGLNGVDAKTGFDAGTGDYSSAWLVRRDWDNRTSLIIDPKDGHIPEMTAAGKYAAAHRKNYDESPGAGGQRPDNVEEMSPEVRCITFGSPRFLAGYNNYTRIEQTPNAVAINMELIHDVRMIPLDGRPHLPSNIKNWLGDSAAIGKATLVLDTTNYKAGAFMGATDKLHVTERFKPASSPEVLEYTVTIDDPLTWTKPWTAMIPLRQTKGVVHETIVMKAITACRIF